MYIILINPNVNSFTTYDITDEYYIPYPKSKVFHKSTYETNSADILFHELGHILYSNKSQDNVIIFNNIARHLLKLKPRNYDETHNRAIKH